MVLMTIAAIGGCSSSVNSTGGKSTQNYALPDISGPEPSIPSLITEPSGDPAKSINFKDGGAVIRPDGSMTLPLDLYDSADDKAVIAHAETALAQQCMRSKGFELPPSLVRNTGPQPPAPFVLYGVIDMAGAKSFGYRDPVSFAASTSQPKDSEKITQAVSQAYFDNPKTGQIGCQGEAHKKLGGDAEMALFVLLQDLRSEALSAAHRDSRVKSVTSKWSACMKSAGFDYPDPAAPAHDRSLLGRGLPTPPGATLPPPSPAEIAVAVADVTCKRQTQYLQTIALVSAAYQQEIIVRQAQRLQDAQRKEKQEVDAAKSA
ncbi:hypothetical protein [Streptomyces sp. NBC_01431]|uniref:hypothetical protein n=1 Tax=Streptomyces sp. NBC_01431 TaxID=2903863 RepID=UPI002E33E33C|nr:hypothetical protein [Streptomyces sp. NBC_01431]